MPAIGALDSGNPDGEDGQDKQARLAARAARFTQTLPGNRYKQLEEMRSEERKAFEQQGLIRSGKTELHEAVDMRGTCQAMCSDYEREFREWTREVHPFERIPNKPSRIDPAKAVAAYSRSDAGAGHGDSAILPSDLRTPATLVRTLDYLINDIMSSQPVGSASAPSPRKALGYSAGFIRDRTRAIRKEFAMQSSWGHAEAIATYERIARWHILCLRELQEESGTNTDMHIDNAELGRCFTSLRQQYDDRRQQTGLDLPCPNEPEFRAYMLIFDLAQKSISIPTAELPSVILDHPLVKLAWEIRRCAQRNFDSQKEGSKHNSELGLNMITRYIKLLKQPKVPYLLSCLVEIRLRDIRRSALRALCRSYPRIKDGAPVRLNDEGEVVERRVMQIKTLETTLGCEEQDEEESAWDDVLPRSSSPQDEAVAIAERFELQVYNEAGETVGVLINMGSRFNDNRDAPYTRRWRLISAKRGDASFADVVNGQAGVHIDGAAVPQLRPVTAPSVPRQVKFAGPPAIQYPSQPFSFGTASTAAPPKAVDGPTASAFAKGAAADSSAPKFSFGFGESSSTNATTTVPKTTSSAFAPPPNDRPTATEPKSDPKPAYSFDFSKPAAVPPKAPEPYAPPAAASAPLFSFEAPKKDTTASAAPQSAPAPAVPFSFGASTVSSAEKAQIDVKASTPEPPKFTLAAEVPSQKSSILAQNTSAGPNQPFFAAPAPAPTPPLAAPAPLSASTSSLNASASSLAARTSSRPVKRTLSLAKSLSRSQSDSVTRDRVRMRSALPGLADELVGQVLRSVLVEIEPELQRVVKQEQASRAFARRKAERQDQIHNWSAHVFESMIADEAYEIALSALRGEERHRQHDARRKQARLSNAAEREEMEHEAERDRQNMLNSLSHMGLGGPARSDAPVLVHKHLHHETQDEFEADVLLRGAQRARETFMAPSTFLRTVADHISSLMSSPFPSVAGPSSERDHKRRAGPSETAAFEVAVSLSAADASLASGKAQKWLKDKFSIPGGAKEYRRGGTNFRVSIQQGPEAASTAQRDVGLVVFEAPAQSHDLRSVSKDAQDRMRMLERLADSSSCRYNVAILVITWNREELSEVIDRLGIRSAMSRFSSVGVFSLDNADDLDERLASALSGFLPAHMEPKQRQVIYLEEYVARLGLVWLRLRDTLSSTLEANPHDTSLAAAAFAAGMRAIEQFLLTARTSLPSGTTLSTETTFAPPNVPSFEPAPDGADDNVFAQSLIQYLSSPPFSTIDEAQLIACTLQAAVVAREALPIARLLTVIAYSIFGEVSDQFICLDMWSSQPEIEASEDSYLDRAAETYRSFTEQQASYVLAAQAARASPTEIAPSPAMGAVSGDDPMVDDVFFADVDPRGDDFEAAWAENMFDFEQSQPAWRPYASIHDVDDIGRPALDPWISPSRLRQSATDRRALKRSRPFGDVDDNDGDDALSLLRRDGLDSSVVKANKNARLLAAIAEAGRTLSQLGAPAIIQPSSWYEQSLTHQ